ncbi:MAG: BPSS1780 family membrane protein [Pseudomonadota bacterium]
MKLRVVPASQGLQWVKNGIAVCARQPWGFLSLLGLVVTSTILLSALPLIGAVVIVGAMPMIWMAFMLASRRVLSDKRITPLLIGELLKTSEARKRWLKLGSIYAGALFLVVALGLILGPGPSAFVEALDKTQPTESPLDNAVVLKSMLVWAALALPVSLVFWHTPALVYWGRVPVGKALFFSAVASWRNLPAFAVYGACWVALQVAVGAVIQVLTLVVPSPTLMTVTAVMASMWVLSAFYASLYFSVVDCFESRGTATEEDDKDALPADEPPARDDLPE